MKIGKTLHPTPCIQAASHICRNTDNQQLSVTLKWVQKYEQSRVSISYQISKSMTDIHARMLAKPA
ncbi:MAG: hypothetical protein ACK5U2_11805, partial [Microcystis sp.]|uniref:hypothetical protein n=1 Tax=Microcystis sp. TaxID=1127 RepID=UPI003918E7A6